MVSLTFTRDPASPLQLQHVASIPALAYVATGMPNLAELPVGCIVDISLSHCAINERDLCSERAFGVLLICKSMATFPWSLKDLAGIRRRP